MTKWMFDNLMDTIIEACPLSRIGQLTDMAGMAVFLASKASAYVNGAVIPLDGGITIS